MSKSKTKKVKLKTTPHEELLKELEYLRAENVYLKIAGLSRGAHCPRERERAQAIEGLSAAVPAFSIAQSRRDGAFYYHFQKIKQPDKYVYYKVISRT